MSGFTPINRHHSGWTPVNWTPETPAIPAHSEQAQTEQLDPRLQGLNRLPGINSFDPTVNQERPRTALPTSRPTLSVDTQAQASSSQIEEPLKTPRGIHLTDAGRQKIFDLHDNGLSIRKIVAKLNEMGSPINFSSVVKVLDGRGKEKKGIGRGAAMNSEEKETVIHLFSEGKGDYQIAKIIGCDRQSVTNFLKNKGFKNKG
jgi:hypothetical protein